MSSTSTTPDGSPSQRPRRASRGGFSIPPESHPVWTKVNPAKWVGHLGHASYKMLLLQQDTEDTECDISTDEHPLAIISGPLTDFLKPSFKKSNPVTSASAVPSTPGGKPPLSKDFDYYIFKRIIKARLLPLAARPGDMEIVLPSNPPVWAIFGPGMGASEIHGQEQFAECLKRFGRHLRDIKSQNKGGNAGEGGTLYFLVGVM